MIRATKPLLFMAGASLAFTSACTDPGDDGYQKTRQGALLGGVLGAAVGAITNDNAAEGALKGGIIGAGVGGITGSILDKQANDLRRSVGNDNIRITNTGDRLIVSLPQDILFATGSASLRPDLQNDLYAVASNLQQYPNSSVQVVGHTDNVGDAYYNQQLSTRRANSVAAVLINGGVNSARILTSGRGEDQPIASNLTAEGRQQNRRVEIVILPNAS
jgi:outer membrane protein OmpA-like peptidoglycan-associated protein